MLAMNAEQVATAIDGELYHENKTLVCEGVAIDSRQVKQNDIFFALKGEFTDGHRFMKNAVELGAVLLIVSEVDESIDVCQIKVSDTFSALQTLAKAYIKRFPIPFVAITGSSGKTTTKDIVASVLSEKFDVLKTKGNLNSTTGVPLTIFDLMPHHQIGVIEMSMSYPKEILGNVDIVRPETAVITNVGQCHIEFLGSQENIFQAKSEILTYLEKGDTAILNVDDPFLNTIQEKEYEIIGVGIDRGNLQAFDVIHTRDYTEFAVMIGSEKETFRFPVPGNHNVINALIAIAVGLKYGLNADQIQSGLMRFEPSVHRMEIIESSEVTLINDTYNANPDAMCAAIDVLCHKSENKRKIAVLCDMFELGDTSKEAHIRCGRYAAENKIEIVLTTGEFATCYAEGFREVESNGTCILMQDLHHIEQYLIEHLSDGDTVLFKASRGVHLDRVFHTVKEKRINE